MAKVIAFLNLKGGVGKTTTTVAVAEMLSQEFAKRVLVIDLDPQTNATVMLIGEQRWQELNRSSFTLARLFEDALVPLTEARFKLHETLQRGVSSVKTVTTLDLLPSSIELMIVQERLLSERTGDYFAPQPTERLKRAIEPVLGWYDYVLIDCPPNLGVVTMNGLRIAQHYIIPTIPDILSTYGIPFVKGRVQEYAKRSGHSIRPLGILISKFRSSTTLHTSRAQLLRSKEPPVFATMVPEAVKIAEAAEHGDYVNLQEKYGSQFAAYRSLTAEIMEAAQ